MFNLLKLKTMKKNFLFIAFAVVLCWATSCNKEDLTIALNRYHA